MEQRVDLLKMVRILRAYWVTILVLAVLGAAAGWGWSAVQPRVYTADATGYVSAVQSEASTGAALAGDQLAKSKVLSYIDIGRWRSVAESAKAQLGLTDSVDELSRRVKVTNPAQTATLRAEASGPTPEAARDLAQAWLRAMTEEINRLEADDKGESAVQLIAGDSAQLPQRPSSPNVRIAVAAGLMAGLLSGILFALIRRTFDRRLRSSRDVTESCGASVIGMLPLDKELVGERAVFSFDDVRDGRGSFAHKEAMRELRTNLQYVDVDDPARVIVVTSPLPGDGKSTTAANLAVSIAATGQAVMLIDADLRRPVVGGIFGFSDDVGLSEVLAGRTQIEDVAHKVDDEGNLFVVAAGRTPPNPSEMVASQRMRTLVRRISEEMIVIIDSPPTLAVADAAIIASWADGVLLVLTAGRTTDDMLKRAVDNIAKTKGHLLGVVMNRVPRRSVDAGYYGKYSRYYGHDHDAQTRWQRLVQARKRRARKPAARTESGPPTSTASRAARRRTFEEGPRIDADSSGIEVGLQELLRPAPASATTGPVRVLSSPGAEHGKR